MRLTNSTVRNDHTGVNNEPKLMEHHVLQMPNVVSQAVLEDNEDHLDARYRKLTLLMALDAAHNGKFFKSHPNDILRAADEHAEVPLQVLM